MRTDYKSVSRAFALLFFVISAPLVLSFQNCGKGFEAQDISATIKSTQATGAGGNTGDSGSGSNGAEPVVPDSAGAPTPNPVVTPARALSRFVSLHQTPLRIATPPPTGTYDYGAENRTGFKLQYAPTGISGCAIGYATGGCVFPGGGSLALPEFTGYKLQAREFKIYIPPGAKSLMLSGYAPQSARAAFALRFGTEPSRTSALSDSEYAAAQASEHIDQSFANLVSHRSELLVVHDGGGTLRFVAGGIDANRSPLVQGGWLYIRQINGTALYDIQGGIDVDMNKYAAAFSSIIWLGSGTNDPAD